MKRNKKYWRICVALVILIIVLGYTPVMIPGGVYKPELLGMPYSLWLSFLLTAVLVLLTYIGSRVHPGNDKEEEGS
jgi:Na+/proline symporter